MDTISQFTVGSIILVLMLLIAGYIEKRKLDAEYKRQYKEFEELKHNIYLKLETIKMLLKLKEYAENIKTKNIHKRSMKGYRIVK